MRFAMYLVLIVLAMAAQLRSQVLIVSNQPTLAPHDCYCGQSCKCDPCECNVVSAKPLKSVVKGSPEKASVKITNTIKKGNKLYVDYGSGTVIEASDGRSKVLTCWHILREPGELTVYPPSGKAVEARILKSNSKLDLALLEIDGEHDYVEFSDKQTNGGLTACGYEGGGKLSKFSTSIIGFYDYPNSRVAGRPKQGRSGGGLFDKQGKLVGVCSAADQEKDEGIYITYPAVETFLTGKNKPNTFRAMKLVPGSCKNGKCEWE